MPVKQKRPPIGDPFRFSGPYWINFVDPENGASKPQAFSRYSWIARTRNPYTQPLAIQILLLSIQNPSRYARMAFLSNQPVSKLPG